MKAHNFINLLGLKFGRLQVEGLLSPKETPCGQKVTYWLCRCDCGKNTKVRSQHLRTGHIRSCGCLLKDELRKKGPESRNWRGGRTRTDLGYIRICSGPGKGKLEHVWAMENSLGRELLEKETVHHKNGIRDDNRLENLELWASNHSHGQRVSDLLAWAKQIKKKYAPEETW